MTAQEAIKMLKYNSNVIHKTINGETDINEVEALDMAITALGAIEQIQWERDVAIKQLNDLGYGLSEKPREELNNSSQEVKKANVPDTNVGDMISRRAAIDALGHMMDTDGFMDGLAVSRANVDCMLRALPSAQLEIEESLYQYKCFITDTEGLQHEVVHVGDIRRVTGWEI